MWRKPKHIYLAIVACIIVLVFLQSKYGFTGKSKTNNPVNIDRPKRFDFDVHKNTDMLNSVGNFDTKKVIKRNVNRANSLQTDDVITKIKDIGKFEEKNLFERFVSFKKREIRPKNFENSKQRNKETLAQLGVFEKSNDFNKDAEVSKTSDSLEKSAFQKGKGLENIKNIIDAPKMSKNVERSVEIGNQDFEKINKIYSNEFKTLKDRDANKTTEKLYRVIDLNANGSRKESNNNQLSEIQQSNETHEQMAQHFSGESKKCYGLKTQNGNLVLLEDIMKAPPKPDKNIFFHDTSCSENGRIKLSMRYTTRF